MSIKGKKYFVKVVWLFVLLCPFTNLISQEDKVVDQIVAVIGDEIVLHSDIEQQYYQFKAQGHKGKSGELKCQIFEEYLIQKLLVNQAHIDSMYVEPDQVNMQLDQRLDYFIERIGSKAKLEEYFNKSILEIKEEFRDMIRDQLLTQKMQNQITGDISATPSEVRSYFKNLPEDSVPYIESKIELSQIVLYPELEEGAEKKVKEKLQKLRERVKNGESFSTLAVLYSDGPSSKKGGGIGFKGRGELAREYADAAFKLQKGGLSKVVKTDFGYHIIQLIDRKDNKVNTRHILMRPDYSSQSIRYVKKKLDSISQLIRTTDTLSFTDAAKIFSEDKDTRANGGILYNDMSGSTKFRMDEFSAVDFYVLKNLKVGEISEPYESIDKNGKKIFKVVQILSRSEPHKANLDDDYDYIKKLTEAQKKQKVLDEWVRNKLEKTYVQISDLYKQCDLRFKGWYK